MKPASADRLPGSVGNEIVARRAAWSFDGGVADTFVEHIRQSVPGYEEGHGLICSLSDFFCQPDSICYELGTSTGELIGKLAAHNAHKPRIRWIGIDTVPAMLDKARRHCSQFPNVEFIEDDARLFAFEKADLIVSYYTVQFIPPRDRQALLDRIYQALNWGGGFLMFEKVRGPDARFQDIFSNLYTNFKRDQGFSADEILTKAESLKGVLEPFSSKGNLDMLHRAGFVDVAPVFRNLCFEGVLCIK
jgi:tRNA (cmo5U34)-methyltransferase